MTLWEMATKVMCDWVATKWNWINNPLIAEVEKSGLDQPWNTMKEHFAYTTSIAL